MINNHEIVILKDASDEPSSNSLKIDMKLDLRICIIIRSSVLINHDKQKKSLFPLSFTQLNACFFFS